jgi:hypothetical protein
MTSRLLARRPVLRATAIALLIAAAVVALAGVPYLPANPDLYLHLLWTQQVMRNLAQGAAPFWAPDLNAGFGSPGIRLHSPLGPVLEGSMGLLCGTAERGIRVALGISVIALVWLLWRRDRQQWWKQTALLLVLPPVANSLLGRSAFPELLALPLTYWLLETTLAGRISTVREGALLATLWLLHAPSTVMVVLLVAAVVLIRRKRDEIVRALAALALAAGVTAWHWLPLASEMREVGSARALTEGLYSAANSYLGSPTAYNLEKSIWLGWCAVAILAAVLVGGWHRREPARAVLIAGAVALASPLAAWLWRLPTPLVLLQFPFRFLFPASVLTVTLARQSWDTWRGRLAVLVLLVPMMLFKWPALAPDCGLRRTMAWQEVGSRIQTSIGGNPLVVDAPQHRPPSWSELAGNLRAFGSQLALVEPAGRFEVTRWQPLSRRIVVELPSPARVSLRLLDYPFWRVEVDDALVVNAGRPGVIGALVPAGRHEVTVAWAGNPWSQVGVAVAAATLIALCWLRLRRRRALNH